MSSETLTDLIRDNTHLSRPTMTQLDVSVSAINFTHSLPDAVASYVCDSLAPNTRRAYLSDLAEFERWGGSIPASVETVAAYLAARADALAIATIVRHVASISKAHEARGLLNPTRAELVRATLRGIRRKRGCAQCQAKALLRDDLLLVLDAIGSGPKDMRDRALLLIGFAGALRRSELVAFDVGDIEHVRQGIVRHTLRHALSELRNRKDTSKFIILVLLLDLKFLYECAVQP